MSPTVVDPKLLKTKPKEALWIRYIHQRIRENKNFIGIISGPTGCLHEDTKLINNSKTLGELYTSGERFVDTISMTKANYPVKSKSEIIDSGIKEVFRIELEDGKVVFATSEHIFFKKRFKEVTVENLKVGDDMKSYDVDNINNYWIKANNETKAYTREKFNPMKYCKCGMPYYHNLGEKRWCCQTCREKSSAKEWRLRKGMKARREDEWMLWENQILRNYYFNSERKVIKELLLNKRNWNAIGKRATRIKVLRHNRFRHIETTKRNLIDNVSKRPEVRLKRSNQMKEAIKKNNGYEILHFSGKKIRNNLDVVEKCIISKIKEMKI